MLRVGQYLFKRADTPTEFEQIHGLNYRTFVGEIPQHPDNGAGALVDKFHHKNVYLIGVKSGQVVGMLSTHDEPPFSVADRLADPGVLTRPGMRPLEVRLLAIEPAERNTTFFMGLVWLLYNYAEANQFTHLIISGVAQRLRMYQRIGFVALGPAVPCGGASFVPMMLPIGGLPNNMQRFKAQWETHLDKVSPADLERVLDGDVLREAPGADPGMALETGARAAAARICLLPGPVTLSAAVREAFHEPPTYHRGPEFIGRFLRLRAILGEMVGGRSVAILNGSGTLGNEAVAAALAATPSPGRGVLLVNGEFGERLARQALRFGLRPRVLTWPWGRPWDLDEVDEALAQEPAGSWVWGVHLESSTGVLNDLPGLVRAARRRGVRACADCISSLGAVPLDLRDVFLATGSTGKSLGAYAGGAIIFADPEAVRGVDRQRVPSYFDLGAALASDGPCYTFPSPTLRALEVALAEYSTPQRARASYARYAELGGHVRRRLRALGLEPLAREEWACPVVTSFTPPGGETSQRFVERCHSWGVAIGGQSSYLAERRLVQIATMGAVTREMCAALFEPLRQWLASSRAALVMAD